MSTLEKVAEWREGANEEKDVPVPAPARQNDQAVAQLQALMAGVGKTPRV